MDGFSTGAAGTLEVADGAVLSGCVAAGDVVAGDVVAGVAFACGACGGATLADFSAQEKQSATAAKSTEEEKGEDEITRRTISNPGGIKL